MPSMRTGALKGQFPGSSRHWKNHQRPAVLRTSPKTHAGTPKGSDRELLFKKYASVKCSTSKNLLLTFPTWPHTPAGETGHKAESVSDLSVVTSEPAMENRVQSSHVCHQSSHHTSCLQMTPAQSHPSRGSEFSEPRQA